MRRVGLLLLVALMGLVRANAQEVDSLQINSENETIESLSAKVKQLQHDYDFFYCVLWMDYIDEKRDVLLIVVADRIDG